MGTSAEESKLLKHNGILGCLAILHICELCVIKILLCMYSNRPYLTSKTEEVSLKQTVINI